MSIFKLRYKLELAYCTADKAGDRADTRGCFGHLCGYRSAAGPGYSFYHTGDNPHLDHLGQSF